MLLLIRHGKNMLQQNQKKTEYIRDSVAEIRSWVMKNLFEEVVKRDDFSIYTLFVAAYEFNLDDSEPPSNARERRNFTQKYEIRVVLTSIAMAAIIPVL